jgi:hypothetical protein
MEQLTPEELYRRAMRLRLTRAGLLKIMRENDEKAAAKDADTVMKEYAVTKSS